eukprot:m.84559 g.84559  ORF g.84559 m.84559 type:complete len:652 (+) comp14689_c0_seq1:172-2127(+)
MAAASHETGDKLGTANGHASRPEPLVRDGQATLDRLSDTDPLGPGLTESVSQQPRFKHPERRRRTRADPANHDRSSSEDEGDLECSRRAASVGPMPCRNGNRMLRRGSQPDVSALPFWERRRSSDPALTNSDMIKLRSLVYSGEHQSRPQSNESLTPTQLQRRSSHDMSTPLPEDAERNGRRSDVTPTGTERRHSLVSLASATSTGTLTAEGNVPPWSPQTPALQSPLKMATPGSRAALWTTQSSQGSAVSRDSWDDNIRLPLPVLQPTLPEIAVHTDGSDLDPDAVDRYPDADSLSDLVMVNLSSSGSSRRSSTADGEGEEDNYYSDESSCSSNSDRRPGLAMLQQRSSSGTGAASPKDRWKTLITLAKALRVFKRTSYPWVQLAGHTDGFKMDVDGQWILKLCSPIEQGVFERLQRETSLLPYVPQYQGVVESAGKPYIKLENLVAHFESPCVMDVKMGVRTFLEDDVNTEKLRKDLLAKMLELDDREPTEEERKSGVTKMRYMQFRERMSSSHSLGFRIEAMQVQGQANKGFKTLRARSDVVRQIGFFLGHSAQRRESFVERLLRLRQELAASDWFNHTEVVGSSLLFVYSASDTGVWMIDFAKTIAREKEIAHTVTWQPGVGSHEDGYLLGLDCLIDAFRSVRCDRP